VGREWNVSNALFNPDLLVEIAKALVGLRPSFSAQVRSHGKPGQVGEPGAPVPPCWVSATFDSYSVFKNDEDADPEANAAKRIKLRHGDIHHLRLRWSATRLLVRRQSDVPSV
jgi:hypothetical protein